jgi:hypothetical protein
VKSLGVALQGNRCVSVLERVLGVERLFPSGAAFTPKAISKITERIEADAARIVDSLVGAGDIDFVADCASRFRSPRSPTSSESPRRTVSGSPRRRIR